MPDTLQVMFLICSACDRVWPVDEVVEQVHDFETDDGGLMVVHDYHCPDCRAKLASWGTSGAGSAPSSESGG